MSAFSKQAILILLEAILWVIHWDPAPDVEAKAEELREALKNSEEALSEAASNAG